MAEIFIFVCLLLSATLPISVGKRQGHVAWPRCYDDFPGRHLTTLPDYDATHLDSRYCNITELKQDEFNGLPNLEFIEAIGNHMTYIHPAAFKPVPKLTLVYLSDNDFTEVPVFAEHSVPSLTRLELFRNKITGIYDARTFSACVKLEQLWLSYNDIEYLHPDVFKPLTELKMLTLEHNKLQFLPNYMFDRNKKLETLNLSNNKLTYLPVGFAAGIGIVNFYFYDNPWQCACLLELIAEAERVGVKDYHTRYLFVTGYTGERPVCVFLGAVPCRRYAVSTLLPQA